jgi:hypothetical protein
VIGSMDRNYNSFEDLIKNRVLQYFCGKKKYSFNSPKKQKIKIKSISFDSVYEDVEEEGKF